MSGRGPYSAPIPAKLLSNKHPRITVYLVCRPRDAAFSVRVSGKPMFWGACSAGADGEGAVGGSFALTPSERTVVLDVGPDVSWTLAIAAGSQTS